MDALREWVTQQFGSITAASVRFGVPQPLLSQWLTGVRQVPAHRCPEIERITVGRVTCEQLRPDVAWVRVPDKKWPRRRGRPCIDVAAEVQARGTVFCAQTIAILKRCGVKAARSADGRTAAGAVREATAALERLGHGQRSLAMARAAAGVGEAIRVAAGGH